MKTVEEWTEFDHGKILVGNNQYIRSIIKAIQLDAMAHCAWVAKCNEVGLLMHPPIYPANRAIHKYMKEVDRDMADELIQKEPKNPT